MKPIQFFGLILLLTQFISGVSLAQTSAADSAEFRYIKKCIDEGNRQWIIGWESGDAGIVANIFCEDGRMLSGSGSVIEGREAIRKRMEKSMAFLGKGVKVEVVTTKIWFDGTMAYETGEYKYHFIKDGKEETEQGKYFTQWKKTADGSWKLWLDVGIP